MISPPLVPALKERQDEVTSQTNVTESRRRGELMLPARFTNKRVSVSCQKCYVKMGQLINMQDQNNVLVKNTIINIFYEVVQ